MSGDTCNDGRSGSYRPKRKIIHPKAKMLLIIDDRMRKTVKFKGITELGLLLAASNEYAYFFTDDPTYKTEFREEIKAFPEIRAHLIAPAGNNTAPTEFIQYDYYKGEEKTSSNTYKEGIDILPTWKNEKELDKLCDIILENKFSFIPLPPAGMLIIRSIASITPYDEYLGKHYLTQYTASRNALSAEDRDLLIRIKEEGLPRFDEKYNDKVNGFLRIERKLYTQFPH